MPIVACVPLTRTHSCSWWYRRSFGIMLAPCRKGSRSGDVYTRHFNLHLSLDLDLQISSRDRSGRRLFCQGITDPFIRNRCVPACPACVESAALTAVAREERSDLSMATPSQSCLPSPTMGANRCRTVSILTIGSFDRSGISDSG